MIASPKNIRQIMAKRLLVRRKLREFVKEAWHVVEPATEFKPNWHIDAIADHLQAVSQGKIRRLIINIPPRCAKSTIVAVMWPCWDWIDNPGRKWLFSSYAHNLSVRDSVKCRHLLSSPWYQGRWGNRFQLSDDQNQKMRFDNSTQGYRLATSVGGANTGEGGSIVCFPYSEPVWTERGKMPIGEIVEGKVDCRVWSANTATSKVSLKKITGWHKNRANRLVEVGFSDGTSVRCTPEHKFWSNRGWVSAIDLRSSDVLPSGFSDHVSDRGPTNAEFDRQSAHRQFGCPDFFDGIFGKSGTRVGNSSRTVVALDDFSRDFNPRFSPANLLDCGSFDSEFFSENICRLVAAGDLHDARLCEQSAGAFFVHREGSMRFCVGNIFGSCSVSQVAKPVVGRNAVDVANICAFGSLPDECKSDQYVHGAVNDFPVHTQRYSRVAVVLPALEQFPRNNNAVDNSGEAFDTPCIGDDVALKIWNRKPVFVRDCGHADSTFCISVEDNHTFFVGDGKQLCHNCIDDAHNANDMSDQIRSSTLEWWDQTMSTRLNDPKTGAFVIIMQRLHERDLVGHILAKEHGWDHLCLPMEYEVQHPTPIRSSLGFKDPRTTEGELLWPERFGPDEVATLKARLGRGAAGQLQQRPAPAGGDIFKREWFVKNYFTLSNDQPMVAGTIHPNGRRFATVDLAVSQKTTADFTVIASWMFSLGKLFLLDIDRRRIEGPDLVPAIRAAIQRNKLAEVYVEKVGFQATIIQQAQREGLPVRELVPDKDKVTRAYAATPWFEQGKVCFRSGATYLSDLEHELLGFPNAQHDDQVDTVSYACAVAFKSSGISVGFGTNQPNRAVSTALNGIFPAK